MQVDAFKCCEQEATNLRGPFEREADLFVNEWNEIKSLKRSTIGRKKKARKYREEVTLIKLNIKNSNKSKVVCQRELPHRKDDNLTMNKYSNKKNNVPDDETWRVKIIEEVERQKKRTVLVSGLQAS